MRTWSGADIARFLTLTRAHPFNAVWLVLATTCVRRGEALGLTWASLDLDASRVSITRTLVDLYVYGDAPVWSDPKTARGRRSIALDPGTVAVLRSVRAVQAKERLLLGAEYVDHDLVFAHPDGRRCTPNASRGRSVSKPFGTDSRRCRSTA